MKRKLAAALAVISIGIALPATGAFAHSNHVNTPSGQSNCQYLGGPENGHANRNHAGHGNGHTQAIAHEQSDTSQFGGSCPE